MQARMGLSAIASMKRAPIAVRAVDPVIGESSTSPLRIAVTDVFGGLILGSGAAVAIKSAARVSDGAVLMAPTVMRQSDTGMGATGL